ncbi:hypothetical protein O9929_15600 [Vibrio lentus]|nr:hypothetical protein [Vibrio lentus]
MLRAGLTPKYMDVNVRFLAISI